MWLARYLVAEFERERFLAVVSALEFEFETEAVQFPAFALGFGFERVIAVPLAVGVDFARIEFAIVKAPTVLVRLLAEIVLEPFAETVLVLEVLGRLLGRMLFG